VKPFHVLAKRSGAIPSAVVRGARRIPGRWILALHEVGDHPWAYPEARFADLVAWLARSARLVPLAALISTPPARKPAVALTFDDGYLGVAERAVPVLRRHGAPATVFLPTDLVGESDAVPAGSHELYERTPLMGWETVRAVARDGLVAFGSHGATHLPLPDLAPRARREEMARSREAIVRATGREAAWLAYPFGACDEASAGDAKAVGFSGAVTTRHGGVSDSTDRFRLPRVDVRADYEVADVRSALRGDWDFLRVSQAIKDRGRA
jgi:peptidoglycan/xylan/chitin deacetylase (PgdA/CDA1 family)